MCQNSIGDGLEYLMSGEYMRTRANAVESIYVQEWSFWVSVGEVTIQPYSKSCAGNMHVTVMPSAG